MNRVNAIRILCATNRPGTRFRLCAAALLPAAVLLAGCGLGKPTLTTGAAYVSPFNHFEITPPTGWEEQTNVKTPQGRAEVVFTSRDGSSASITIVTEFAEKGETLATDRQRVAFGLSQAFPKYQQVSETDLKLDGVAGYAITFTTGKGDKPRVRIQQIETLRGGKWYTFSMTAPDTKFTQYQPTFQAALASLRWK